MMNGHLRLLFSDAFLRYLCVESSFRQRTGLAGVPIRHGPAAVCESRVRSALPRTSVPPGLPHVLNTAFPQKCLTINVRTIYWNLRIRICSKCAKKAYVILYQLLTCESELLPRLQCSSEFSKDDKKDHIILRCVPFDTALGRTSPNLSP